MIALVLACATPVDPPEAKVGERLFLEPRFAELFAAEMDDPNTPLSEGDPVVAVEVRDAGDLPGPFAGSTMSCRQCHLVDDVVTPVPEGVRTYSDFARRSPIPDRGDGLTETVRNSPALVDMAIDHEGPSLLHFDGEFPSPEALVRGTFTGRNLGWLPTEHDAAVEHVAAIIRADDGTFPLAAEGAHIPYATLFAGTDPSIPEVLRVPESMRVDVTDATDDEVLDAVAGFVAAYLRNIRFARGLESGELDGSPYDVFLAKNGLPRAPDDGEAAADYALRLRAAVDALGTPAWVDDTDRTFALRTRPFAFGEAELRGLRLFLATPDAPVDGRAGACVACHVPPEFTDYSLHNTGVSQEEYDGVWGDGAFATLAIPDLATRTADPSPWLPPTPAHPDRVGAYKAVPSADAPTHADLGAWAIFGDDDHADAQDTLRTLVDAAYGLSGATDADRLDHAVGLFKTPSVRASSQSAPYLHSGAAADLDAVLAHYVSASAAARAGTLRNADPRLADVTLGDADLADLRAFLLALDEDYE